MRLTRKNIAILVCYVFFFLFSFKAISSYKEIGDIDKDTHIYDVLSSAKMYYNQGAFDLAIEEYNLALKDNTSDSLHIYKQLAFSFAKLDKPDLACQYIDKYIKGSLDVSFVGHSYFDNIGSSDSYKKLADKYLKKVDGWSIFCFYVGFIGFFVSVVLNFRRSSDRISNLLMSAFVLIHSFFMIHMGIYLMNYDYYLPHTLYMSISFSFVYGPLIYFYFKRVTLQYSFRKIDFWHLLPTLFLITILLPIYLLPAEEKLRIRVHNERPYFILITLSKLTSLLVYGVLVIKIYLQSVRQKNFSPVHYRWQRNIVIFCSTYILSYAVFTVLVIQQIVSGFLFYMQITTMALLVLYVGYTAFTRPSIFGKLKLVKDKDGSGKYEKSGLTESLSLELKEKLLHLLNHDKIYKQNDISLHKISELLDTTRHNASQIINEHFDLNFFELINTYRIEEAMRLLKSGDQYLNIIDVAYEVGFNNKVTFNKSFKKYNQITPSEYLKSLVA
ncbi:helix-turn-helix transcriptional regulator [Aquimarina gracilis]|uniref:Helix-turn-helix transcriptional regulator n=1 Tax=Aquimarina gracilis TaxID=874422 RepID=A0ABU5ZRJ4_9FLAO|nr:helix-turn-helix transcriptional regulator [Aquimarina gracilis]MEB3344421.1 helix-turn-helix transcriptional regulator [Aquimarina gracilis]